MVSQCHPAVAGSPTHLDSTRQSPSRRGTAAEPWMDHDYWTFRCSSKRMRKSLHALPPRFAAACRRVPDSERLLERPQGSQETHIWTHVHSLQNFPCEVILLQVRDNSLHAGVWALEDRPKQRFDLVPPLLNRMNVSFRRATFVAWTYDVCLSTTLNNRGRGDLPRKVQARANKRGQRAMRSECDWNIPVPVKAQLLHFPPSPIDLSHLLLVFRHWSQAKGYEAEVACGTESTNLGYSFSVKPGDHLAGGALHQSRRFRVVP
jgi:hypothetical protein